MFVQLLYLKVMHTNANLPFYMEASRAFFVRQ
jgi:hypothetical protein